MMQNDKATALKAYLTECQSQNFSWGKQDCALFAADWVVRRTGTDYAKVFRGQYHTERESQLRLSEQGFEDLSSALHQLLGEPLSMPLMAQRGDVALVRTPIGIACGIVTVGGVMARGYRSLKCIPMSNIIAAWRID